MPTQVRILYLPPVRNSLALEALIKMKIPHAPGNLSIGDYVFATRWSDADWNDPWCVGFVSELGKNFVCLSNEDGTPIEGVGARCFRNALVISGEQGSRIVQTYPEMEGSKFDEKVARQIVLGVYP